VNQTKCLAELSFTLSENICAGVCAAFAAAGIGVAFWGAAKADNHEPNGKWLMIVGVLMFVTGMPGCFCNLEAADDIAKAEASAQQLAEK